MHMCYVNESPILVLHHRILTSRVLNDQQFNLRASTRLEWGVSDKHNALPLMFRVAVTG
jgi:hypothetical protein